MSAIEYILHHFTYSLFMKIILPRPAAFAWLMAPALAGGLLLSSCNSQPTATETDKTATVVSDEYQWPPPTVPP